MLESQRIEIRRSEIRARLADLAGSDAPTDEEVRERTDMQAELRKSEAKLQDAIKGEDAEAESRAAQSGETGALDRLADKAELRQYVICALNQSELPAREAELSAAFKLSGARHVPWAVIAPKHEPRWYRSTPERESRADASTSLAATGPQVIEDKYLGRVFAGSIIDYLAIRTIPIEFGERSIPVLTAGVAPAMKAKAANADAEAGTVSFAVLSPKRASAAYVFSLEDLARSPELEPALRMDLAAALTETISNQVLNGNGTAPNVNGLLSKLTDPTAPTAVIDYDGAIGVSAGGVEGKHARNLREVRTLFGTATYSKLAGAIHAGSGYAATDYLDGLSGGVMATSLMPAAASTVQQGILALTAIGGNGALGVWNGVQLTIRDEYSKANTGEIRLTANALIDFEITRAGGFQQVAYKLST